MLQGANLRVYMQICVNDLLHMQITRLEGL